MSNMFEQWRLQFHKLTERKNRAGNRVNRQYRKVMKRHHNQHSLQSHQT